MKRKLNDKPLGGVSEKIYSTIKKRPSKGWTLMEMIDKLWDDGVEALYGTVSGRLSDLKASGYVKAAGKRKCGETGYNTSFYVPAQ